MVRIFFKLTAAIAFAVCSINIPADGQEYSSEYDQQSYDNIARRKQLLRIWLDSQWMVVGCLDSAVFNSANGGLNTIRLVQKGNPYPMQPTPQSEYGVLPSSCQLKAKDGVICLKWFGQCNNFGVQIRIEDNKIVVYQKHLSSGTISRTVAAEPRDAEFYQSDYYRAVKSCYDNNQLDVYCELP